MSTRRPFLFAGSASKATWVVVLVLAGASFAACSAARDDADESNSELYQDLNGRDRMPLRTYLK